MTTGPDADRLDHLEAGIEAIVDEHQLASCQYAVGFDGEVVATATLGDAPDDARYLMFSATKVVPAAVTWRLLSEGLLERGLPVATWWPEFGQHGKGQITVEHLLTHQAGLPAAAVDHEAWSDRSARAAQIESWTPSFEPGSRSTYHPVAAHWILVELISRVTGMDHRDAVRQRLTAPLGLDRLELGVPEERQSDIQPLVPTGAGPTFEELTADFGKELAEALMPFLADGLEPDDTILTLGSPEGYAAGVPGAGGVSDASSLALLYQELLHNRRGLWDAALLREATGTVICFDPGTVGNPSMRGLGVDIAGEGSAEDRRRRLGSGFTSPAAFGHSGAGGQIGWADPETGLSFAFLTNAWDRNPVRGAARDAAINRLACLCRPS